MHRLLFDNQQHLKRADLERYAGQLKLDAGRFGTDLDHHAYLPNVRRDIQLGDAAQVRATPGFFRQWPGAGCVIRHAFAA